MPDSSGLFIAMDAGQRSPALGVADVGGGATVVTGLQMVGATPSRDGKWIVAAHQEGCCTEIQQREIWIAPRAGGSPKVLVRSKTDLKQPVGVIGIDAQDRLLYRDGRDVLRMPVGGGQAQMLGRIDSDTVLGNEKRGVDGDMSPDGTVVLLRTLDPDRWYVVANDRVARWPDAAGSIVEDRSGIRLAYYAVALWVGPHAVLAREPSGRLAAVDVVSGQSTTFASALQPGDIALAHDRGRLLLGQGRYVAVLDLATGRRGESTIDLGSDLSGIVASALPGGGFVISTAFATYRID